MSQTYIFLSDGQLHRLSQGGTAILNSVVYAQYQQRLKEIQRKNEWKTTGTGAKFTGAYDATLNHSAQAVTTSPGISAVTAYLPQQVIYTLNVAEQGGVYIKDLQAPEAREQSILVSRTLRFYDLDAHPTSHRLAVAVSEHHQERHIALMTPDSSDCQVVTEGDSFDSNPSWSRANPQLLYYDSRGMGYDNQQFVGYGPTSIYRLNVSTQFLDEVVSDGDFDCFQPFEDAEGNLFYLKRPYKQQQGRSVLTALKDALLAPFRLLTAVGHYLNFFTMRYSGKSLKTQGANPAKMSSQSPKQLFVAGNLLEVEKARKANERRGEKYPGYIPASWVLMKRSPDGTETTLQQGVMSYTANTDGSIIYANGKHLIRLDATGTQTQLAKAHLATHCHTMD